MPDYTFQISTKMQPLLRRDRKRLILLLKRAHDVPVQDLQYSQLSKLEFQETLGMQNLPVT